MTNEILVHSLQVPVWLMGRYLSDLGEGDLRFEPGFGGNSIAHILGHLIWVERKTLAMAQLPKLPELGDLDLEQFGKGRPRVDAGLLRGVEGYFGLFQAHRELTVGFAKHASAEMLASPFKQFPELPVATVGELVNFVGLHSMMHAGQISMLRRSMGKPAMF